MCEQNGRLMDNTNTYCKSIEPRSFIYTLNYTEMWSYKYKFSDKYLHTYMYWYSIQFYIFSAYRIIQLDCLRVATELWHNFEYAFDILCVYFAPTLRHGLLVFSTLRFYVYSNILGKICSTRKENIKENEIYILWKENIWTFLI